jgi:AraC-like DNA-binding protein
MLPLPDAPPRPRIVYSCYVSSSREGEQFIPEHVFSYQAAGSLLLHEGDQTLALEAGTFRFFRRNTLVKFDKQPPPGGGEFKSLSVTFSQDMLRAFSQEYGYQGVRQPAGPALLSLPAHPLYQSYLASLQPYEQFTQPGREALLALKVREAVLVLLQVNPELRDVLFDFTEPGKIDLAAFMQKNFRFNVALSRFAYLTGRSLATFKRDFEKLFQQPPGRWLVQRRLQEAHYLLKEKGKAPAEVYLEVGFEDLSHFSFAFKKAYGLAPSKL